MKITLTTSGVCFDAEIKGSMVSGRGPTVAEAIGNAILANQRILEIEIEESEAVRKAREEEGTQ